MEKDEEKILSRRRLEKWIKIFLVFLVFMWVCTIISKSIYVSRLPRVETQTPGQKYIEHTVEADGIVTAGGEWAVNTAAGLRISEICVQEGDFVEKGDVLFSVDLEDLTSIISGKETELTTLQYHLADKQFNEILDSQKKEIALLWAQEDYASADEETAVAVERARAALQDAENDLNRHLATAVPYTSDSDRESAWEDYNNWKKRYYELSDEITAKEREIAELEEEIAVQSDAQLEEDLRKAKEELTALQDELTQHERSTVSQPDYSAEESAYDSWQQTKSALEDAVESAKQALEDADYARESTLRQKLRDIASAEVYSQSDSTTSIYELEIAALQAEIAGFQAIKGQNGEIKAENDGFVSKIQIVVGGRTADTAAMLLADADEPCRFRFGITKEQGRYLRLGDSVELTLNDRSGETVEATVDYLTENASGGYDILCCLPEGAGEPGMSGTVRRTVQGELHHIAIPVDALYKEQEAYYIYVYKEKTGILGNEAYAEKLKVQVADQNDRYAALESGTVSADTQVITFCSEELVQGAAVRLAE